MAAATHPALDKVLNSALNAVPPVPCLPLLLGLGMDQRISSSRSFTERVVGVVQNLVGVGQFRDVNAHLLVILGEHGRQVPPLGVFFPRLLVLPGQLEAEFSCIQTFFAENAWEELETWILAGLSLPNDWRWNGRSHGEPTSRKSTLGRLSPNAAYRTSPEVVERLWQKRHRTESMRFGRNVPRISMLLLNVSKALFPR